MPPITTPPPDHAAGTHAVFAVFVKNNMSDDATKAIVTTSLPRKFENSLHIHYTKLSSGESGTPPFTRRYAAVASEIGSEAQGVEYATAAAMT